MTICRIVPRRGTYTVEAVEPNGNHIVRYDSIAQVFHWLTAILALAAFILGPGGSEQRVYSPANAGNLQLHEALGTTVLALMHWCGFGQIQP